MPSRRRPPSPSTPERLPDAEPNSPESASYTLEDLARQSGLSVRTIRYYQSEKLLPRPERDLTDARVARYPTSSLERLRLIGELSDRGLKLPAIRDLLNRPQPDRHVADWLGLDASLRGSWGPVSGRLVPEDEINTLLADYPRGTKSDLEAAGLITRQGSAWFIRDERLLQISLNLVSGGIHTDVVLRAGEILQIELRKAAAKLVELFVAELAEGFNATGNLADTIAVLRPVAGEAAQLIFATELEDAINDLLADTKRLSRR